MLKFIVAIDKNNGIGYKNGLPWKHCKEDMQHFVKTTNNSIVVMGYNTFISLRDMGVKLPNRKKVVIVKGDEKFTGADYIIRDNDNSHNRVDALVKKIKSISKSENNDNVIVIGGSKTYELFSGYYDEGFVTKFNEEFICDSFLNLTKIIKGMTADEEYYENLDSMVGDETVNITFNKFIKV